jgi:hypothetical protein
MNKISILLKILTCYSTITCWAYSRQPLPEEIFRLALIELGLCDENEEQEYCYRCLKAGILLRDDEGTIRVQHKSVKDWLEGNVKVDSKGEIHRCLANVMERVFQTIKREWSLLRKPCAILNLRQVYAIDNSVYHLLQSETDIPTNNLLASSSETESSESSNEGKFHQMANNSRDTMTVVNCASWFEDFDRIFWLCVRASVNGSSGFHRIFIDRRLLRISRVR